MSHAVDLDRHQAGPVSLTGRSLFKDLIAIPEYYPRLLASGPDMPGRSEPRCIVERPGSDPNHPITRRTRDPRAAFGAYPTGAGATAICETLERPRLYTTELVRDLGDYDGHREGAAGKALAIPAMTSVDLLGCFSDFVADLAALAAARLWKLHRLHLG